MPAHVQNFDELPNQALVSFSVASIVTGESESTLWRKSQTNPLLKPIRLSSKATRLQVGTLRQYMAGVEKVAA